MREPNAKTTARPDRRKRKYLLPDLQMKILFVTLSVAVIVLAANFQFDLLAVGRIQDHPPPNVERTFDALRDSLVRQFLFALLFAVPIALWVGIVYSFRFCGPIYSLLRQVREGVDGRWDRPYVLRKSDDLQDLKDAMNLSREEMCRSLERQNELLLRSARCLRASGDAGGETEALLREIDEQSREHARRFGGATEREAAPESAPEDCVRA